MSYEPGWDISIRHVENRKIEHLVSTSCCYNSFSKINSNTKNTEITISPFGLFWLKLYTKTNCKQIRDSSEKKYQQQTKPTCQNIMSDKSHTFFSSNKNSPSIPAVKQQKLPLNSNNLHQHKHQHQLLQTPLSAPATTPPFQP